MRSGRERPSGSPHRVLDHDCRQGVPVMDPGVFDIGLFLKGALLGFSIAAPVGPIGVLCIRRTLARGMVSGFVSGLGAATADGIYGAIAAFGLASLTGFLVSVNLLMRIAGGYSCSGWGGRPSQESPRTSTRKEMHPPGPPPWRGILSRPSS